MVDLLSVPVRLKYIPHSVTIIFLDVLAAIWKLHAVDVGGSSLARVGSNRFPEWISGGLPSIGCAKTCFLVDCASFFHTPSILDHSEESILLLPRLGIQLT